MRILGWFCFTCVLGAFEFVIGDSLGLPLSHILTLGGMSAFALGWWASHKRLV